MLPAETRAGATPASPGAGVGVGLDASEEEASEFLESVNMVQEDREFMSKRRYHGVVKVKIGHLPNLR